MTTPSQSAPQEVPQWALCAVHEIETMTRLWVEKDEEERAAAIITKHAAAISEENERLKKFAESVSKSQRDGWAEVKGLQLELTALRQWSEQAREALKSLRPKTLLLARDPSNGNYMAETAKTKELDALLQSHPAAQPDNSTRNLRTYEATAKELFPEQEGGK